MATFVLVPGFWLGAWAWRPIAERLRAQGHTVYPVTLTGLAERAHLAGPSVNLTTHITDVTRLIEVEDLRDVVLAGHSGGGVVAAGVVDRIPERLAKVVYVDSAPLPDGLAWIDTTFPAGRELVERSIAERGNGQGFPLPEWNEFQQMGASLVGMSEEQLARMRRLATPQPAGMIHEPLRLTNEARKNVPKIGVLSSFSKKDLDAMVASGPAWVREVVGPGWTFVELPTGHWPMFSRPDDLADVLQESAA